MRISAWAICYGRKSNIPKRHSEFQAELANDPRHVQSMLYLADADIQMNQNLEEAAPLLGNDVKSSIRRLNWRISISESLLPKPGITTRLRRNLLAPKNDAR
jgi:hypothetical protein